MLSKVFNQIDLKKIKALQNKFWEGFKKQSFFPQQFNLVLFSTAILWEDKGTKGSVNFL